MSVLVLAPHQDDECIGMGGTILYYTSHSEPVTVLYMTGNSERMEEAAHCAEVLGTHILTLDQLDGFLEHTPELVSMVAQIAMEFDVVYSPHQYEAHPDHHQTAMIAKSAVPVEKLRWYEIWTPLRNPNYKVNITEYLSLKRAAIRCHKSQLINGFDEAALALNKYRAIMSGTGAYSMEVFRLATN